MNSEIYYLTAIKSACKKLSKERFKPSKNLKEALERIRKPKREAKKYFRQRYNI